MYADQILAMLGDEPFNTSPLMDSIRRSAKFHLGDWQPFEKALSRKDYVGKGLFSDELPHVRLPYPELLLTYDDHRTWEDQEAIRAIPRCAIRLVRDGDMLWFMHFCHIHHADGYKQWHAHPVQIGICYPEDHEAPIDQSLGHGRPVKKGQICAIAVREDMAHLVTEEFKSEAERYYGQVIKICYMFLLIMSCRNIKIDTIAAPAKLNARRSKDGKPPLLDYHVLSVLLPGKHSPRTGARSDDRNRHRLHLCRGHFKEYTANAPLFGHVTGRFWWQPAMRGDKNLGIIHKDYDVRMDTKK